MYIERLTGILTVMAASNHPKYAYFRLSNKRPFYEQISQFREEAILLYKKTANYYLKSMVWRIIKLVNFTSSSAIDKKCHTFSVVKYSQKEFEHG